MTAGEPTGAWPRPRPTGWIALAALAWMLLGVRFVPADRQGVVSVLGRIERTPLGPGVHWSWPWPIGRVTQLRARETRRIVVGFADPDRVLARDAAPASAHFLSGDRNVVAVRLVVQYAIRDPARYLTACRDVERVLATGAESALVSVVAGRAVDTLLTTGKSEAQLALQRAAQQRFDAWSCGVSVLSTSLESIVPPSEVREAFNDVASAREDRSRLVREAESYANELLPLARGQAEQERSRAAAYRAQLIDHAHGDARRFVLLATEARSGEREQRTRLYLETMERVLPRLDKTIVDRTGGVDLDIVRRRAPPG